ncbi:MAG: restriction endonuclease subunit S [Cognatishimia sp.]|uniref:restriction endonuclease subunit S n=1 Tax=Cognatishimia sp. TaxID=2211648 RepID=UPI003B8AE5DD
MSDVVSSSVPELRFPEFSEEWARARLGDFMSFKNGVNAQRDAYGDGAKFINVMDIIRSEPITYQNIIGRVEVSESDFIKNEVKYGDILFQRSSETREEVGQSNIYLDDINSAVFGGFVIRGRPIKQFDPRFFNALLKTQRVRKDMTSRSGGSTRFNIGQDSLSAVEVNVPPKVAEQQKIAGFIEAVSKKLTLFMENRAAMEDYKRGLMQQLFSQTLRFTRNDGTAFPDWEGKRLGKVFVERSERGNEGAELLSVTMDRGVVRAVDVDRANGASADRSNYKTVYVNDIAYNSMRMWQGANGVSSYFGIVSPAYTVITPNKGEIPAFWGYYFKLTKVIREFQRYSQGLTSDTWNLKFPALSSLKLPVPHPEEQQKIADALSAIDAKIDALNSKITQLETFKKGLLQKMFV